MAGGADALRIARLRRNPLPRHGGGLRAPYEGRSHGLSEIDSRADVVDLLQGHRGRRWVRCGDQTERVPDRDDSIRTGDEGYVGRPAWRLRPGGREGTHQP